MEIQIRLCVLVGFPDGRKAGGFRCHDIHAVPVIRIHGRHSWPYKFHDLVLDIAALKDRPDNGQSHIMRTDKRGRASGKINGNNARIGHIIGVSQKLLYQFSAAFSNGHGPQGTISGMAVGAENHAPAAGHHFPHVLMDNGNVRGNKNPAVFFCGRKSEYMIILINGTANCAQGVVAVGHNVWNGKFIKP